MTKISSVSQHEPLFIPDFSRQDEPINLNDSMDKLFLLLDFY